VAPPAAPDRSGVPFAPGGSRADATVRVRVPSTAISPSNPAGRKRMIVIAVSAVLVLAAAAVLIAISTASQGRSEAAPPQPAVAPRPAADAGAARAADAAAIEAAAADAAPKAPASKAPAPAAGSAAAGSPGGECAFNVGSAPAGAEILIDRSVVGTTPGRLTLPCGVELKLSFRKPRYLPAERRYTPTPAGKPLKVVLAKPSFSVRVSSSPSGATVTVGGKSQGATPTMIRLPANEASTVTISKEGFVTSTQRITAKQNNQAVHTNLKRTPRRVPR
jgi:hypothetical protein